MIKKTLLLSAALLFAGAGCGKPPVTSFEDCVAAGNPVMESYPRQCRADGTTFVETVDPEPAPPVEEPSPEGPVTLGIGESKAYGGGLTVTLTSIDDSRCPQGVQCIWAGELTAVLTAGLSAPGSEPAVVRLGPASSRQGQAFGWTFTLEKIDETSATIAVVETDRK